MAEYGGTVVIGAGLGGLRTGEWLRAHGDGGPVAPDPSLRADSDALGVDCQPGGVISSLDEVRDLGQVVIATGADPVRLPGLGAQRVLRSYDDALALRALLRPGLRMAIVGAGWIGAELATAAAGAGCKVTVVEGGALPLAAAAPAPMRIMR